MSGRACPEAFCAAAAAWFPAAAERCASSKRTPATIHQRQASVCIATSLTGQRWLLQAYIEVLRCCCLIFTGTWKNTAILLLCWKHGPELGLSMAQPWTFALLRSDCFPVWQHASSTSGIMQGCMSLDIMLQALRSVHNVRYNRRSLQFTELVCVCVVQVPFYRHMGMVQHD